MSDDRSRHARRPSDLEPHEMGVAAWFEKLERPDAPLGVLSSIRSRTAPNRLEASRGGLLRLIPLGAWGVASAALLFLALGAAAYVELSDPVATPAPISAAASSMEDLTIVDDSRMTLFHEVETFDDVGLAHGHLIADWGR